MIFSHTQAHPVVLITGAARRIGATIAHFLHQKGMNVIVHYHTSKPCAEDLVASLNQTRLQSACTLQADLSAYHTLDVLISQAVEIWGRLDGLVHNASIFVEDKHLTLADWPKLFAINVYAPMALSYAAWPYLEKQTGSIINITDIHAEKPLKGYAMYCQSKAALSLQTQALAKAFAPSVRVNAIAPGAIMWPEAANELQSSQQQAIIAKTPLKRHGDPHFIAESAYFLLTQPFITGQTLKVDGGRSL
ncbi:MAG TPA: pteridine reductase [Legionellales bacterium]|nr:pteridine reductase [Legionellales bacterium]